MLCFKNWIDFNFGPTALVTTSISSNKIYRKPLVTIQYRPMRLYSVGCNKIFNFKIKIFLLRAFKAIYILKLKNAYTHTGCLINEGKILVVLHKPPSSLPLLFYIFLN